MKYTLTDTTTVLGKVIVKPDKSFSFLSYLIKGDHTVLIDTVPERSAEIFLQDLSSVTPLEKLDALILNHSEEDHSGALGALLAVRPDLPIYCTPACEKRLAPTYPHARFHTVESGSTLSLGSLRFRFTHTPGLHWDDNMVTYFENEQILFSNDLFGQAIGGEVPLDTAFTQEAVVNGAAEYFDRVFSPASREEKAAALALAKLSFHFVAPGHGVVLQKFLPEVLSAYRAACN